MAPEYIVGYIFLACAVVLGAGFIFTAMAARSGPDDYEPIHRTGYMVRRYWFIGLMVVGLVALGLTIPKMPYPLTAKPAAGTQVTVVKVTGQQWEWVIAPSTLRVGKPVEFKVTSKDVNHDFAIFNSDGQVVAQVQAMPTVTNDLYLTFKNPGTYTVRCLELCGLYHTSMLAEIKVTN